MIRMIRLASITVAMLTATAGAASAAVNRAADMDASHRVFEWSGAPTTSVSNSVPIYYKPAPEGSCNFPTVGIAVPTTAAGGMAPFASQGADPLDYCDATWVHTVQGRLDIALPSAGDGTPNDWDVYVYRSNRYARFGPLLASSENTGAPESITIPVATDYYLVNAVPRVAVNSSYTGRVTYVPPTA